MNSALQMDVSEYFVRSENTTVLMSASVSESCHLNGMGFVWQKQKMHL